MWTTSPYLLTTSNLSWLGAFSCFDSSAIVFDSSTGSTNWFGIFNQLASSVNASSAIGSSSELAAYCSLTESGFHPRLTFLNSYPSCNILETQPLVPKLNWTYYKPCYDFWFTRKCLIKLGLLTRLTNLENCCSIWSETWLCHPHSADRAWRKHSKSILWEDGSHLSNHHNLGSITWNYRQPYKQWYILSSTLRFLIVVLGFWTALSFRSTTGDWTYILLSYQYVSHKSYCAIWFRWKIELAWRNSLLTALSQHLIHIESRFDLWFYCADWNLYDVKLFKIH